MPCKVFKNLLIAAMCLFANAAQADMQLNWQIIDEASQANIAITYKDRNHIVITANADVKLLKLHNDLYILQNFHGAKVALNLSELGMTFYQENILNKLTPKEANFLPVMVLDGSTRHIKGFRGDVIKLLDFDKSVTIVSSQNEQHTTIKNAILPMLIQLVKRMPNLPNRRLIDLLKRQEFGLPLLIDDNIVMTRSETIDVHKNTYSLAGYKVIGSTKSRLN
ncbi:MAG: hypothetical protein OCD03_07075 [Hyphomicrobiales bacterium]